MLEMAQIPELLHSRPNHHDQALHAPCNIVSNIVYNLRGLSSVQLCLLQLSWSLAVSNPGVSSFCQHFSPDLLSNMLFINVWQRELDHFLQQFHVCSQNISTHICVS